MKARVLLLFTLVVAGAGLPEAQQSTAAPATQASAATAGAKLQSVVIQVNDPSGAPVAGAQVRLAPMPDSKPESMQTDPKGQLLLQMRPGRYGIFVAEQGFAAYNSHLDVAASGAPQTVPVMLRIARFSGPVVAGPAPDPNVLTLTVAPFTESFPITQEMLKGSPRRSAVVHNPHSNADEKYEGVLLGDLLAKYGAPLGKDLRGPALANYVVATGSDGYKVVYSLAELDATFHPGDVIIADTMDGKPLDAHTGPFRLVSTEDKRPARGVRNLISIEVKSAQ